MHISLFSRLKILAYCFFLVFGLRADAEPDLIVAAHYPPLMIAGDLERPGFNVEIILEAARRLEREVDLRFLPFPRALKTVSRGHNVLQPALLRKPEREVFFTWVVRTTTLQNSFNTLGAPVDSLEEGRGLKWIGVETASAQDVFLSTAGFENLSRVDRPEINAQKLKMGRIDAWALPHIVAQEIWASLGYNEPLVGGASFQQEHNYIIASPSSDPEFVSAYREMVEAMLTDGTVQDILLKYGWPED